MAVDTSADKRQTIDRAQAYCSSILDAINALKVIKQEALDKGYASGPDAITDAFLNGVGGAEPQLAFADITAAFAAIDAIDALLIANSRAHVKALVKMRP